MCISIHIPTSQLILNRVARNYLKHSDELLFSFDLNNVTRHVRQTVVTITKSECSLSLKTEQYRVLLNHFSKVKC